MRDLHELLLRIVLPIVALLLIGLAAVTLVGALSAALWPLAVIAVLVAVVWIWFPPRR